MKKATQVALGILGLAKGVNALDRPDGYVPFSERWREMREGQEVDLGSVLLQKGGTVEVRIRRPDGSSAGGNWRVSIYGRYGEYDSSREVWVPPHIPHISK